MCTESSHTLTRWQYLPGSMEALSLYRTDEIVKSTVEVEAGGILDFFRNARTTDMVENRRSLSVFWKAEFVLRCVPDFFQMFCCHENQWTTVVMRLVPDGKSAAVFCKLHIKVVSVNKIGSLPAQVAQRPGQPVNGDVLVHTLL